MYNCINLEKLDDYFTGYNQRKEKGVFFCRFNGYNNEIDTFIRKYYNEARACGIVIEGKIPNPDEKNLGYYEEIMGNSFEMNENFFSMSFRKWLPRLNTAQREDLAKCIYAVLDDMRKQGKNENMLKNAYIKFMCWLYYKFERILNQLGGAKVPKILYEGTVSKYELNMLSILSNAGSDIVLLQYKGDSEYLKLDPNSNISKVYNVSGLSPFPTDFSINKIYEDLKAKAKAQARPPQPARPSVSSPKPLVNSINTPQQRPVQTSPTMSIYQSQRPTVVNNIQQNSRPIQITPTNITPKFVNCTNVWGDGDPFNSVNEALDKRGDDNKFFYNCFFEIVGAEDKSTYVNNLYQMYMKAKSNNREVYIVNDKMDKPQAEEVAHIKRTNCMTAEQMIYDISSNIIYPSSSDLAVIMKKAFIDLFLEESKNGESLGKLTEKAVYLICWLNKYKFRLFPQWEKGDISLFIYFGTCTDESEALFLKFLSRLPTDVIIIQSEKSHQSVLEDKFLLKKEYEYSMELEEFPTESTNIRMGTAAYHAERELNDIMYQDSGMYRNQQYQKAMAVTLHTMYEEIAILWEQELRYRPNFSVVGEMVNMPVIFAKVSGVKDGNQSDYWKSVKKLLTNDTVIIRNIPFRTKHSTCFVSQHASMFWRNGQLQRQTIKNHQSYQYGHLREEIQDYMFDKLEMLINKRIIKGTFENGMEYNIVSTILSLSKEIIRLIQKFDFTKVPPKIVCVNVRETQYSIEDCITFTYLNLIGFDIVFFSPAGYQTIEKYLEREDILDDHQIGEYICDMRLPELKPGMSNNRSWKERLFGK